MSSIETRPCNRCKGSGEQVSPAFEIDGRHYPEHRRTCSSCKGHGNMMAPDFDAIALAIAGRGGKLKSKRPADKRAYFVWRMARFHGGADVTMPVMASVGIYGDPFEKELEIFSEDMAKKYFGTDLAAVRRWLRAYNG